MRIDQDSQRWSEIDRLEDKALGMFTGGMLLSISEDALSKEVRAFPVADPSEVEAFLDSIGLTRVVSKRVETVGEMREAIGVFVKTYPELAMAARNFETMQDEAVRTVYEELADLVKRSKERG